jgi:hypothetical protein
VKGTVPVPEIGVWWRSGSDEEHDTDDWNMVDTT